MEKPYQKVFAANLRYYMALRHKTQAELARTLHIGQSLVSKYYRGERLPRMDKLDAICAYLECSRSDLLGVDADSTPVTKTGDPLLDQLLTLAADSPPGAVRMTIQFLERLNAYAESLGIKKEPSSAGTDEGPIKERSQDEG